jgi:protein phosphatase
MTAAPPIVVASAAATSIGAKRDHNEDAFLAEAPLFLVADGMGGYEAGEVASAAAIGAFGVLVGERSVNIDQVREAYRVAGTNVMAVGSGGRRSAGTTLAGVAITENDGAGYWLVLNVGDSRTYRFAGGALEQISVDHSLVQELIDAGELTADQASRHANRNVVTRALGAGIVSEADFWMLPAALGDRMIVCSDGLSGEVDDSDIAAILAAEADPQVAARRLIDAAMEHGGRDNITVVVVDALAVSRNASELEGDTVPRQNGAGS